MESCGLYTDGLGCPFACYTCSQEPAETHRVKNWKALRDADIEKQSADESCGAASVATILRAFYGVGASEQEIADTVSAIGVLEGTFPAYSRASFSDLDHAVRQYGFRAVGLDIQFEQLLALRIPVVAHLIHREQEHFTVIRGVREDGLVWLGDPAWGNRKLTAHQFREMSEKGGTGRILILAPEDGTEHQINAAFFGKPKTNASMFARIPHAPSQLLFAPLE